MLLPGPLQTARVMAEMVDLRATVHSSVNLFHCGDPVFPESQNPLAADFVQFILVTVSQELAGKVASNWLNTPLMISA